MRIWVLDSGEDQSSLGHRDDGLGMNAHQYLCDDLHPSCQRARMLREAFLSVPADSGRETRRCCHIVLNKSRQRRIDNSKTGIAARQAEHMGEQAPDLIREKTVIRFK